MGAGSTELFADLLPVVVRPRYKIYSSYMRWQLQLYMLISVLVIYLLAYL